MATEKFRRQLRHEAEQWWADGLIDAKLYERLAERYQLDQLEQDASHRFIGILLSLGAVLLGLGAITFVAANWQVWPRAFKLGLLLCVFLAVNVSGFYLWRRSNSGWQKLGHSLLILGALLLGATLALVSQMFHQSGNFYELLLVWGLGVTAMAYSLRLSSLGILSLILVGSGYLFGWSSWAFDSQTSSWQLIIVHMPLLTSLIWVPLAYWCRSRALFGCSTLLVALSIMINLRPFTSWWSGSLMSGWIMALAFVLPPALLWSYRDRFWWFDRGRAASSSRLTDPQPEPHLSFQALSRSLSTVLLSFILYFFSYRFVWEISQSRQDLSPASEDWAVLIDVVILLGVTLVGWISLCHPWPRSLWLQAKAVNSGVMAVMLISLALLLIIHFSSQPIGSLAIFVINALLFGLAILLVRDGLAQSQRHAFWGGMLLLVLGITTRMLEYQTGLLWKAIVFALCGVGVILAGLWFERQLRPTLPPRRTTNDS